MVETAVAQNKTSAPRVETTAGTIEGVNNSGVYEYKGVPYAKPPVRRLRWRPPQPLESWSGVRSTKNFGPRCIQRNLFEEMVFRSYGMSEDCLYLNVWSPTNQEGAGLPVLVYFYGGELLAGDGSEPRYDGENMARTKGIVTLTVNYRLSVFGFFAHPELSAESPHNASGNYGLLDQAAALRWVRQNISQFGGDPNRITIAGESAGSMSVSAHMASPLSRDLIAGAIGESGSIMGTFSTISLEQAERKGVNFQKVVGADSVGQLRDMSFEKLIKVMNNPQIDNFSVAVDGYFLPKRPVEIYDAGEQADVPLLLGWNSQEMSYQALLVGQEPTPENYKELIKNLYPFNTERVLELYPGNTREQVIQSAEDLTTDRFIRFSTWKWGDIHAETSGSPVYRYYYTHSRPPKVTTDESSSSSSSSSGAEYLRRLNT
ncbi:MAG: carboxylesterase family protein [Balneolaceae bacterium]|nr:carboxylesterase family protein [Balneolaceae bacterium]